MKLIIQDIAILWVLLVLAVPLAAQHTITGCETVLGLQAETAADFAVTATGNFINSGIVLYTGVTTLTNDGGFSEQSDVSCIASYDTPCTTATGISGTNTFDNSQTSTTIQGSAAVRMYDADIDRHIQLDNEWQIVNEFTFNSGMVTTNRSDITHFLHFLETSMVTGNSDAAHVNGYAAYSGNGQFVLPIGDGSKQQPAAVVGDCISTFVGAYFSTDPSAATLPTGAPFSTVSKDVAVQNVSMVEYWDIDGATPTTITLTYDAASGVSGLTYAQLASLTIVGWDGSQWVEVPSTFDATSVLGGASDLTSGSISTDAPIAPDTYIAYTLGAVVADTDGDGVVDATDINVTDPCIPAQLAGYTAYDATNAIWSAADCDGDNVLNGAEDTAGTDPYNGDTDGDGVQDDVDTDPLDPCVPAQTAGYTGYDATNAIWSAADCDGDNVLNGSEDTAGTGPYNGDTDGDGVQDDIDTDPLDPCVPAQTAGYTGYDATNAIWSAADCDGDNVLNGSEDTAGTDPYNGDTDGDGVQDDIDTDPLDPCVPTQTAGYTGYDATNAIWSAADCDGDNVLNGAEDTAGTDPYNGDTDGDGVQDDVDTDPLDPCVPTQTAGYTGYDATNAIWSAADCDGDNIANGVEDANGTEPYSMDTDGDGVPDDIDTDPLDPCVPAQLAGYTGYDATNAIWSAADCDGDNVLNGAEDTAGTDPYNGDTDGDGVQDDVDTDPLDPCVPAQLAGYTGYDATTMRSGLPLIVMEIMC